MFFMACDACSPIKDEKKERRLLETCSAQRVENKASKKKSSWWKRTQTHSYIYIVRILIVVILMLLFSRKRQDFLCICNCIWLVKVFCVFSSRNYFFVDKFCFLFFLFVFFIARGNWFFFSLEKYWNKFFLSVLFKAMCIHTQSRSRFNYNAFYCFLYMLSL